MNLKPPELTELLALDWHGLATLHVPAAPGIRQGLSLPDTPVRFDAHALAFSLVLAPDSPFCKSLKRLYQRGKHVPIELQQVRLSAPMVNWQLEADGLQMIRSNPLSEWGGKTDVFLLPGPRRLVLAPTGNQSVSFTVRSGKTPLPYAVWYDNWNESLWLPSYVELPAGEIRMVWANGTCHVWSEVDFQPHEAAIQLSLQMASGTRMRPRVEMTPRAITFCGNSQRGHSQMPLVDSRDEGACREFIHRLITTACHLPANELESLQWVVSWLLEAKSLHPALELRY